MKAGQFLYNFQSFTDCVFLIAYDLVDAIGSTIRLNQYHENNDLMIAYRKYIGRIFGFLFHNLQDETLSS